MIKYLACVLLGVVLTCAAFGARAAMTAFDDLAKRVAYTEGYLGALDQMLRSR